MFNDGTVFVLSADQIVYRIEMDRETQQAICDVFSQSVGELTGGKTKVQFDGNYKPENDEYLSIKGFKLADGIKVAIRNPLSVDPYRGDSSSPHEIKAVFVGERIQGNGCEWFNVAFQKYKREQNISMLPFRLFFSKETFTMDKRPGIGITDSVDCFFTGEELLFHSFYYARQIFNLNSYYRTATDAEVESFANNKKLAFEDVEAFQSMANTHIRRRIAMINDSGVLEKYSAREISNLASQTGIMVQAAGDKLVIPAQKNAATAIIAFLDEGAYRGPFSNDLLLANSKRVLE